MPGPLKIAVWHHLPSGGGKRALFDQVKGLLQRGHHVEVWCPEESDTSFLPLSTLIREHRLPLGEARTKNWRWGVASAWAQTRGIGRNLKALAAHCRACAEEINRQSFDVVLAHPSKLFYMHPLARFVRTPTVIYLQEVYRWLYEARPKLVWEALECPDGGRGSPRFWSRLFADAVRTHGLRIQAREERRAAREYELILVNSLFSRESIVRTYGLDAQVCYLGIDTEYFKPDHLAKENFILGIGGLFSPKGAHLAIEALGLVPLPHRLPLLWVGNFADSDYLDRCHKLAKRLDVAFRFDEMVEEEKLLALLRRARLLVYPAVLEPFGYAPLEANACGTPAVGIAEGGLRETVKDGVNGLLAPNRNPAALAEAITRILANAKNYERLCQEARTYVEKQWGWKESVDRLESCLLTAMGRSKPAGATHRDVFAVAS